MPRALSCFFYISDLSGPVCRQVSSPYYTIQVETSRNDQSQLKYIF